MFVGVSMLIVVSSADAENSIYTCRDQYGKTMTSDQPIPNCVGVMRELGPSGIVRREIAAPLTPEQQRQKDADDRARRAAEEVAREKRRRDTALLAAYQNTDQIEAARKRALSDADASIKLSQERMIELVKEKKSLQQEALQTYGSKPLPPLFQRRIDDNQALIDDEDASIKTRQADIGRINQRYDDDLKRFQELTDSPKK
jgi:hypothetical protein